MQNNYFKFKNDKWDYLIVLDACRFDYFSHLYRHFFDGDLSKVFSVGSHTLEWRVNTFREYHEDIIYVSANAYINSIGEIAGFDARKHFYKVVDVWHFGWDEELGTVHPETVTKVALSLKDKYPDKRLIIHYLQPHAPYISERYSSKGFPKKTLEAKLERLFYGKKLSDLDSLCPKLLIEKIVAWFSYILNAKLGLGNFYTWKLREHFNLPPTTPMDTARRKLGINNLRKAYVENLKIVLSYVAFLVSNLPGNAVITADHGEFLGEKRMFDHPMGYHDSILRIVPWFKITSVKKRPKDMKYSKLELSYKLLRLKQKLKKNNH